MGMISNKLRRWGDPSTGREGLSYWCQGCEMKHSIHTKGSAGAWGWNGDVDRPTFTPSVLVTGTDFTEKGEADYEAWHAAGCPDRGGVPFESAPVVCHTFITGGQVQFLSDCTHKLAGQTLPLPDLPEGWRS